MRHKDGLAASQRPNGHWWWRATQCVDALADDPLERILSLGLVLRNEVSARQQASSLRAILLGEMPCGGGSKHVVNELGASSDAQYIGDDEPRKGVRVLMDHVWTDLRCRAKQACDADSDGTITALALMQANGGWCCCHPGALASGAEICEVLHLSLIHI